MDQGVFDELQTAKLENYKIIYQNERINQLYNENIRPMFREVYCKLLEQAKDMKQDSVLYKHHIQFIQNSRKYYSSENSYLNQEPNQIVADYISSMTDDYFVDLYNYLFPHGKYKIEYISYFDV